MKIVAYAERKNIKHYLDALNKKQAMNQQSSIQNIAKYLGRFVHEVKANNAISLQDINKVAENVVVPVFREIFDCPNLVNLNLEQGNMPGVDLGDKTRRIAFQITSTAANDKIKHTLEKFTKFNLNEQYDVLYVYIITEKQGSYADGDYNTLLDNRIHFDKNRHILDYTDVMKRIDAITDYEKIKRVEALLEAQFRDRVEQAPVPPVEPDSPSLQIMVAQGKTAQVIERLLKLTASDSDLHNQFILLSSRFTAYEKQRIDETLDISSLNIERNKINNSLLALLERLPPHLTAAANKNQTADKIYNINHIDNANFS